MPGTGLHRALQGTQHMARVPHSGEERKVAMHGIYEISETREAVQRARAEGSGGYPEKSSLQSEEEGTGQLGSLKTATLRLQLDKVRTRELGRGFLRPPQGSRTCHQCEASSVPPQQMDYSH